jgi:AAA family ATP:ADP antiporter
LGLSLLEFIELIHFSYSLILILSLWAFVTVKLYNFYKSTLQDSLLRGSRKLETIERGEQKIRTTIRNEIDSESSNKVIRSLNLTANYEPNLFEIFISDIFKDGTNELKHFALNKAKEYNMLSLKPLINELAKGSNDLELKKAAADTINSLDETDKKINDGDILYKMVKSRELEDRIFAAKILGEIQFKDKLNLLTDLAKDFHPKVRKAAISAIAKSDLPELWPRLVENLNQRDCVQAATSAIITIGERILPTLEQSFYKSGYTTETMLEIIRIYGIIGGTNSEEYLLKKINYPDGRIVKQSLLSLKNCGYRASQEKRSNIHQVVEETISNTLWNMVALEKLQEDELSSNLKSALNHEVKENYEFLFLLLSLAYDPQSIKYVQENIESGTTEGIGYAIELLDIFIAEELKPKLFPILEDNTINDKVKQLEPYYPIADYSMEGLIRQIINRNYNYTNRWTKACAIMAILKLEAPSISMDVIANLFNQDRLLRQCAAWVIYNLDEDKYHECTNRIDENLKRDLDESIALKIQHGYPLLYDLTNSLSKSQSLQEIDKYVICRLADHLKMSKSLKNEVVLKGSETEHCNLYYLWEGSVSNYVEGKIDFYTSNGQFFGPILWPTDKRDNSEFKSESNSIYFVIKEEQIFDLMNQYNAFAHAVYSLAKEGHALQMT